MFKIVAKRRLNAGVTQMRIEAPKIAAKAKAGQFIIFRVDEKGERVPLTIADTDAIEGTITIIYQIVGASTKLLDTMEVGDSLLDIVGPLGVPTHIEPGAKKVCVIGGGVGCAIAYPQAKALHNAGIAVDMIAGFRNKELIILQEEMTAVTDHLYMMTDDGSAGEKGFVTDKLKNLITDGAGYDTVIAIGPVIMMKFVCEVTRPFGIKTLVSLNPIMVDGTGMCGGCRVTVAGKTRFACVEGPDFDGHEVDFDELLRRNAFYKQQEGAARDHACRLIGEATNG